MAVVPREQRIGQIFVSLADGLVADFDVMDVWCDLTAACLEVLDFDAAGLLISDKHGQLRTVASSGESTGVLELFELQVEHGPGRACFTTGEPVTCTELAIDTEWPKFTRRAYAMGYRAVHARPLRLREETIGAMTLLSTRPGPTTEANLHAAQALADVATISVLQQRATAANFDLTGQLQAALDSRVIIEQAKATLAERHRVGVDDAFKWLRDYARQRGLSLREVAQQTVDGVVDPGVSREKVSVSGHGRGTRRGAPGAQISPAERAHPDTSPGCTPFRLYADPDAGLSLAGELDRDGADSFAATLDRLLTLPPDPVRAPSAVRASSDTDRGPAAALVVDAEGLRFVDHHALLAAERVARHRGRPLVLRAGPPTLTRLAELLGLEAVRVEVAHR